MDVMKQIFTACNSVLGNSRGTDDIDSSFERHRVIMSPSSNLWS